MVPRSDACWYKLAQTSQMGSKRVEIHYVGNVDGRFEDFKFKD